MIMIKLIMILVAWTPGLAESIEIDAAEVHILTKSRSTEELDKGISHIQMIRAHLLACEVQLVEGLGPRSCFKVKELARETRPQVEVHLNWDKIEDACLSWAQNTSDEEMSDSESLSPTCAGRYRQRVKINRYKRGHDI